MGGICIEHILQYLIKLCYILYIIIIMSLNPDTVKKRYDVLRMLLDMDTYLPDDILTKVDRASMKYALECRCPILDHEVIEYSYSLPQEYKIYQGNKKRILKDIAYDYIPRPILD